MESRSRRRKRSKHLWLKVLLGVVLVALIFVAGVFLWQNKNTPEPQPQPQVRLSIELNGEDSLTLEYGDAFQDPGAVGTRYEGEQPYSLQVQTESNVDLSKIGEYSITYFVSYQGHRQEKVRKISVVDTKSPVIELVSDSENFPSVGETYQEEGFTATDNYDGDITAKVQRTVSEDGKTITYRVTDSSGNQAEVVRSIVYVDRLAPVLTLSGSTTVTLNAGGKWSEPGYTAKDAVDGDLTSKVTVSGKVDVNIAGTYTLNYRVTDSSGNAATVQRVVIVNPIQKPKPNEPNGEGKVIYLTFDDGPGVHTLRLLGILEKYDVKATFFVCKTGHLELLDDIAKGGHAVGIHSKTHNYGQIYSSTDAFFADFNAMRELIIEKAGVVPTVSRFPGGSSNRVSKQHCAGIMTRLTKAVQDLGYQYFDWNIDSGDAGGTKTADGVFNNVTGQIARSKRTSFVVLQHDIYGYSVDAVERIIKWGLENGYTFAALDLTSPVCHHSVVN